MNHLRGDEKRRGQGSKPHGAGEKELDEENEQKEGQSSIFKIEHIL